MLINEKRSRKFIGSFFVPPLLPLRLRVIANQIRIKRGFFSTVAVLDVRQFMHECVPEPIDPVVPHRQNDDGRLPVKPKARAINLRVRQWFQDNEPDAAI
jgi:hypothetical protein